MSDEIGERAERRIPVVRPWNWTCGSWLAGGQGSGLEKWSYGIR